MAVHGKIEIQIYPPAACVVSLRGEHDAASSEPVTLALAAARGYRNVLVDLAACTFVDSSLINALLRASHAREVGGAFGLVVPSEANPVRRTLELANVQMVLPFHATREAGLAEMTAGPRRRRRANLHAMRAQLDTLPVEPAARRPARPGARPGAGSMTIRAHVVAEPFGLDADAPLRAGPPPLRREREGRDEPDTWGEHAA